MTIPVFNAGQILTASELNDAVSAVPNTANIFTEPQVFAEANTYKGPQMFEGAITQVPGAGVNNETPFAQYGDFLSDFIVEGLSVPVPSPASLTATLSTGTAVVLGQRTVVDSIPNATNTYAASSDTYVSLSQSGVVTYTAVANGATAPTPASDAINILKVVTSNTIQMVCPLAPRPPDAEFNVVSYGADPTGVIDSTNAIQCAINAANILSLIVTISGPATNIPVVFPSGAYLVSSQLTVPNRVTLVAQQGSGATITTSQVSGYMFQFVATEPNSASLAGHNKAMVGPFHLLHSNIANTTTALFLGGASSTQGTCAQTVFDTVSIDGFYNPYMFGYNTYMITFFNCAVFNSANYSLNAIAPNINGSGEAIKFISCVFYNNSFTIIGDNFGYNWDIYFIGCSFDYTTVPSGSGCVYDGDQPGTQIKFLACHFEWDCADTIIMSLNQPCFVSITDGTILYTNPSSPAAGLFYLNGENINFRSTGNYIAGAGLTLPYVYEWGPNLSHSAVYVDDPALQNLVQPAANFFGTNPFPSNSTLFTQSIVPDATEDNQAVNLGQFGNFSIAPAFKNVLIDGTLSVSSNAYFTGITSFNWNMAGAHTFPQQGLTVGWNFSSGNGEVDLMLGVGAGSSGGLNMYQLNSSGDMVSTTPIFALSSTGSLTLQGTSSATATISTNSSTLTGTTAGTLTSSMPEQGVAKKFMAYASAYENDTTTAQTITFPTAFNNTPGITTNLTGLSLSVSTTELTINAPNSTEQYSGIIIIEGF